MTKMDEDTVIENGVIYVIQHNNIPDLKYVGQTTETLGKRWKGHLSCLKKIDRLHYRLYFLLTYYGIQNFDIREYRIYRKITRKKLDEEEKKFIREIGTMNTQHSNDDITFKITNDMKNDMINRLIQQHTSIVDLYKLIHNFQYDYTGKETDFELTKINKRQLDGLLKDNYIEGLNCIKNETTENNNTKVYEVKENDGLKPVTQNVKQSSEFKNELYYKSDNIDTQDKSSYEKHLDRINNTYRNSREITVTDEYGKEKTTTEAREQKRLYYYKRNKYEMNRQRILREYHSSRKRNLTKQTIDKYKFTTDELYKGD